MKGSVKILPVTVFALNFFTYLPESQI